MQHIGPIIVVDDDLDDQFILKELIAKLNLPNRVKFFGTAMDVLSYLRQTPESPFIILCDINMPQMDGLELRREIIKDEYLREKSIPFVFFTTGVSRAQVIEAYQLTVQGLFLKESSFRETENTLKLILNYWQRCKHPNVPD